MKASEGREAAATAAWLEDVLWWPLQDHGRPWLYALGAMLACAVLLAAASLVPLPARRERFLDGIRLSDLRTVVWSNSDRGISFRNCAPNETNRATADLNPADVQLWTCVRNNTEMTWVVRAWGHYFPHINFVFTDPAQTEPFRAETRTVDGKEYTAVITNSREGGIHETLVMKLYKYIQYSCQDGGRRGYKDAHWILRFDSDTMLFPARFLKDLQSRNSSEAVMTGYIFNSFPKVKNRQYRIKMKWPNGGAGVLYSHTAQDQICSRAMPNFPPKDAIGFYWDDVIMGRMAFLGNVSFEQGTHVFGWWPPAHRYNNKDYMKRGLVSVHNIDYVPDLMDISIILNEALHVNDDYATVI